MMNAIFLVIYCVECMCSMCLFCILNFPIFSANFVGQSIATKITNRELWVASPKRTSWQVGMWSQGIQDSICRTLKPIPQNLGCSSLAIPQLETQKSAHRKNLWKDAATTTTTTTTTKDNNDDHNSNRIATTSRTTRRRNEGKKEGREEGKKERRKEGRKEGRRRSRRRSKRKRSKRKRRKTENGGKEERRIIKKMNSCWNLFFWKHDEEKRFEENEDLRKEERRRGTKKNKGRMKTTIVARIQQEAPGRCGPPRADAWDEELMHLGCVLVFCFKSMGIAVSYFDFCSKSMILCVFLIFSHLEGN